MLRYQCCKRDLEAQVTRVARDNARFRDKVDKCVVGGLTIWHHSAAILAMQVFVRAEHNGGDSADCGAASRLSLSRISVIDTEYLRPGRKIMKFLLLICNINVRW